MFMTIFLGYIFGIGGNLGAKVRWCSGRDESKVTRESGNAIFYLLFAQSLILANGR